MAFDNQVGIILPNSNTSTAVLARAQASQAVGNVVSDSGSNAKEGRVSLNLTGKVLSQVSDNLAVNSASNAKTGSNINSSTLKKVVDNLNDLFDNLNIGTKFEAYEKMKGVYYIRVYNKQTNETISEFPPTKYLDMISNFINGTGNLVDRKV